MDVPRQSSSVWRYGLGGLLLGAFGGWVLWGDAPPASDGLARDGGGQKTASAESALGAGQWRTQDTHSAESGSTTGNRKVDFLTEMRAGMKLVAEWDRLRRLHATIDLLDPAGVREAASQVRFLPANQRWTVAWVLGEHWAGSDPAAAMAYARELHPDEGGTAMMSGVFQKWAAVDPAGATAWIEALPPGLERNTFTRTLLQAITKGSPAAALEMAGRLKVDTREGDIIGGILSQWAADDPAAAASAALGLPLGNSRDNALSGIAGTWASHDPAAALAWAGQLSEAKIRREALVSAGAAWARNDPAAAVAWAQSGTHDPVTRQALLTRTLSEWMSIDPAAAQAEILALPAGRERETALSAAVLSLGRKDFSAALQLLGQLPAGRTRRDASHQLIYNSDAMIDPGAADQIYRTLQPSEQNNLAPNIASRMAQHDVGAALQWAEALSAGQARRQALNQVAQTWAQNDPRAALEWVLQNIPPTKDENPLHGPFSQWMNSAPDEALQWAMTLPAGDVRDQLGSGAVVILVSTEPERALAIFSSHLSPKAQAGAASSVASAWAQHDPAAALAWVAQLPAGGGRRSALSSAMGQWAESDPVAATGWLSRMPVGEERDAAVGAFSYRALNVDPESALAWAATIGNQSERANQIEGLAENWLRNDPAGARQWIQNTNQLPPDRKAQLLRE